MAYADAIRALEEANATARSDVEKYGTTARSDIENAIAEALKELTAKSEEASSIITTLEGSAVADPTRWVSTARGQIDQAVGGMLDTLIDLNQRGGMRSGTPGLNSIIESTVNALTPLAGQLTREAMGTKKELGLKRASLAENLGLQTAGLLEKKGTSLANVSTNLASTLAGLESKRGSEMAGVYKAEASDLNAIEREKEKLKLAMALAGQLTPASTKSVVGSYGVDPRLSAIYGTSGGGGSGGSSGGSSGGGGSSGTGATDISTITKALKEMGMGSEEGAYYKLPNENAIDYLARQSTVSSLNTARSNVANNLAQASNPYSSSNLRSRASSWMRGGRI